MTRPLLFLLCVLVAGCAKHERGEGIEVHRLPLDGKHAVYFLRLNDGTRCAVYGDGGISCDWKRAGVER